nr:tRNA (adenosine(37)-N6)-dimethylallyltransferase MiaA [Thermospira aquatica]
MAVVGPTASGKSEIAVRLALTCGGEIVSCDSVQIYRGLDIGSAKPSLAIREVVPHHCLDRIDPPESVSAGLYKRMAEEAICDILRRGKIPIVVGGTGLYFNALYYGLFEGPVATPEQRKKYAFLSLEELLQRVAEVDPEWFASNETKDRRRLTRVLEVYDIAREKLSTLQKKNKRLDVTWYIVAPQWPREVLYQRIDRRAIHMVQEGLIEETEKLCKQWGKDAFALQSLGYKQVLEYLEGCYDKQTMIETIQRETRRYAKRQLTWFRKNKDIHWFYPSEEEKVTHNILSWLETQSFSEEVGFVEGTPWP